MIYRLKFNLNSLLELRNYKKQLFLIIFVNTIISLTFYLFVPREFVSHASMLPSTTKSGSSIAASAIFSQLGYNMDTKNNPLTNPNVIKKIVKNDKISTLILNHIFESQDGEKKEIFYFLLPKKDINDEKEMEFAKLYLNSDVINVYQELDSSIINFKITTNDPNLSFEICQLVFKHTIDTINEMTSRNKIQKLKFLKERSLAVKDELSEKQKTLTDFQERNIRTNSPSLKLEIDKLSTEIEIVKNVYISMRNDEEAVAIEVKNNNNGIFLIDEPYLPKNKSYPKVRNLIFLFILLNAFAIGFYILKNSKIQKIEY